MTNMHKSRVLFMGHGAIGVDSLKEILKNDIEIAGIMPRKSDRMVSDKNKSVFALAQDLNLFCFKETNPNHTNVLEKVSSLKVDYIISIQYDKILKSDLFRLARIAAINLHFSPLPKLRGCFPTKWAIINNENSGVTLHHIDRNIDSGDIISQRIIPLEKEETDQSLYNKLQKIGFELFTESILSIKNYKSLEGKPQNNSISSHYPKKLPFDGKVDLSKNVEWIERFIRAFTSPPHPAAKLEINSTEVQLIAPVSINYNSKLKVGDFRFINDNYLEIECLGGSIQIKQTLIDGEVKPISCLRGHTKIHGLL